MEYWPIHWLVCNNQKNCLILPIKGHSGKGTTQLVIHNIATLP